MKCNFITLAAICFLIPALAAADDEGSTKLLLTTTHTLTGQDIQVPANPKLQVSMMTIAPGESLPVHKHPFPRYAYVQEGELDVTLVDNKKVIHFKRGDAFAEVIGEWHFGTNNGKTPVKLLVIDQMPQDTDTNTVKQK